MSKQKMLAEFITGDIISYIMEDQNLPLIEAMRRFYASETFAKLVDSETGLYLESSPYVYDIFKAELENGKLVQLEV
ncbi:hypothetical protein [Fibrobacter sp.]|uniref:hypothetical protein n=1 Tax=Fibrobacter sp. TaxID=35828 RepID=UPI00388DC7C9